MSSEPRPLGVAIVRRHLAFVAHGPILARAARRMAFVARRTAFGTAVLRRWSRGAPNSDLQPTAQADALVPRVRADHVAAPSGELARAARPSSSVASAPFEGSSGISSTRDTAADLMSGSASDAAIEHVLPRPAPAPARPPAPAHSHGPAHPPAHADAPALAHPHPPAPAHAPTPAHAHAPARRDEPANLPRLPDQRDPDMPDRPAVMTGNQLLVRPMRMPGAVPMVYRVAAPARELDSAPRLRNSNAGSLPPASVHQANELLPAPPSFLPARIARAVDRTTVANTNVVMRDALPQARSTSVQRASIARDVISSPAPAPAPRSAGDVIVRNGIPMPREREIDIDEIVERVVQRLSRQLAIEAERRGATSWRSRS